jgi:hypothetical protein
MLEFISRATDVRSPADAVVDKEAVMGSHQRAPRCRIAAPRCHAPYPPLTGKSEGVVAAVLLTGSLRQGREYHCSPSPSVPTKVCSAPRSCSDDNLCPRI